MKVGVFDSGVGGLFFAQLLQKKYPEIEVLLYNPPAAFPLGTKSHDAIADVLKKGIYTLADQGTSLVVLACHTASLVFSQISSLTSWPCLVESLFPPTYQCITNIPQHQTALLLGSSFTARHPSYGNAHPNIKIYPATELIQLIEESPPPNTDTVQELLKPFATKQYDYIISGCSHLGWVYSSLQTSWPHAQIIEPTHLLLTKISRYIT